MLELVAHHTEFTQLRDQARLGQCTAHDAVNDSVIAIGKGRDWASRKPILGVMRHDEAEARRCSRSRQFGNTLPVQACIRIVLVVVCATVVSIR